MEDKKIGLASVIATGVGIIVGTGCIMSMGQGAGKIGVTFIIAMIIACVINILTALSLSELSAIMPNITGGLPQYTLACMGPFAAIVAMVGGYLACNVVASSVECAMFGNVITAVFNTNIPSSIFCVLMIIAIMIANLRGLDIFAKVQNIVAYGLIISMLIIGICGIFGISTSEGISQPFVLSYEPSEIISVVGLAFFMFIGAEFIIPIAKDIKNPKRNVPLGMILSLLIVLVMQSIVVLGMHNYTSWDVLINSNSPHVLFGTALFGKFGSYWMAIVSLFAVVSTVNSVLASIAYLCAGMARINLLPEIFEKRNKYNAPYISIILISTILVIINITGLSSSDELSFMILIGCVFWLVAYIFANINVLILRKRAPKVPRNFKVPGGVIIPILGIIGNLIMIYNIDGDSDIRLRIYKICILIFAILSVYAFFWIKYIMKEKMFKPMPIKDIVAMEDVMYRESKKRYKQKEV